MGDAERAKSRLTASVLPIAACVFGSETQTRATETNRYAATCLSSEQSSGVPEWSTDEEEEEQTLLRILNPYGPDLYDYSDSPQLPHCLESILLEIQHCLHFTNNTDVIPPGQEGHDRLQYVLGSSFCNW